MKFKRYHYFLKNFLLLMLISSASFSMKREAGYSDAPPAKRAKAADNRVLIQQLITVYKTCCDEGDVLEAARKSQTIAELLRDAGHFGEAIEYFKKAEVHYNVCGLADQAEACRQQAEFCEKNELSKPEIVEKKLQESLEKGEVDRALEQYYILEPALKKLDIGDGMIQLLVFCMANKINCSGTIAEYLYNNRMFDSAIRCYEIINWLEGIVRCYMDLGKKDQAIKAIEDNEKTNPVDKYLAFRCYMEIGDWQAAVDNLGKKGIEVPIRLAKEIFQKRKDSKGELEFYKFYKMYENIVQLFAKINNFEEIKEIVEYLWSVEQYRFAEQILEQYSNVDVTSAATLAIQCGLRDAALKILKEGYGRNFKEKMHDLGLFYLEAKDLKVAAFLFDQSDNIDLFEICIASIENFELAVSLGVLYGRHELVTTHFKNAVLEIIKNQNDQNENNISINKLKEYLLIHANVQSEFLESKDRYEFGLLAELLDNVAHIESEIMQRKRDMVITEKAIEYYISSGKFEQAFLLYCNVNNFDLNSVDRQTFTENFYKSRTERLNGRAQELILQYCLNLSLDQQKTEDLLKAFVLFTHCKNNEGADECLTMLGLTIEEASNESELFRSYFRRLGTL